MKKLLLIDGMAAVYRAYFAMSATPRINTKGMNTGATLGFTMSLYDLLRSQRPTHVGVAFDLPAPTFRHEMYADYKAHREPMPEDIEINLPWIGRVIDAFRIPRLTCAGFEADDVIGTLSHRAELSGFDEVLMATPDKDFAQLVTSKVKVYRYGRGKMPDTIMGVDEVCAKFDVQNPRQVIDLLGLWGDAIDNIPGIRGVGEKTAKKLIAQFGSIEEMVAHVDEIKNEKLRENVRAHSADALFSKQLATIRLDAPIEFEEEALRLETPDYGALRAVCDELEFRQFAQRVYTDLSVRDPQQAMLWQEASVMKRSSAIQNAKDSQPKVSSQSSLFDVVETTPAHAVGEMPLTADVMGRFKGNDVAVFFAGSRLYLSTHADEVYSASMSDVDLAAFGSLMADGGTTKLCYDLKNMKYIFLDLGMELRGNVFDVQLAHYLIDAEVRHTLEFICSSVLGFEPTTPGEQCAALWQLYPRMVGSLRDAGLDRLYRDVELPLVDVLIEMEREGVRIDVEALKSYSHQLTAERADMEKQIYALAGVEFNISSPKQLGEVLYEHLKVTNKPPRTATHQYSTAEDVLVKLADRHAIIPLILEYRSVSKLIGTYLDAFPKLISPVTGRLHTVYNQTVTATGRLSSSNPNLQNIPIRTERGREIRRAFVARDSDHLILAADYSQIELRIIASLAHDVHMLDAFNQGHDIHAATAAKIYKVPLEDVTKEQRRNAKSVNFGIVYGISAFGLAEQLGIARKEAASLIDEYFTQYPDIRHFIDSSVESARRYGYARTLMGRRRYLPDITSRNAAARSFAERNAVNMPIQGSSADMIKLAMVRIYRAFHEKGLRSRMILQVHDELVFDLYRDEEQQVREIVEREMKQALPLEGVDIEVGIDVGDNWLQAH